MVICAEICKKTLTGILDEIECKVEIRDIAIVGIGDGRLAGMTCHEVGQHLDFLHIVTIKSESLHIVVVLTIHHQDHIEMLEVGSRELTRPAAEVVSPSSTATTHARIRQLPYVPSTNTSRVY